MLRDVDHRSRSSLLALVSDLASWLSGPQALARTPSEIAWPEERWGLAEGLPPAESGSGFAGWDAMIIALLA